VFLTASGQNHRPHAQKVRAMSSALVFPASKTREIATADPDVKEISKQAIEVLRHAAQLFAHSLFAKCHEEAVRHKHVTSSIRDFLAVVTQDEALHAMLAQFLKSTDSDSSAPEAEAEAEPEPEEEDEPNAPSEIEEILKRDLSDGDE
jgi:hypothetical protein